MDQGINKDYVFLCLFADQTNILKYRIILKSGFKHCLVIVKKPNNSWLFVNPLRNSLVVKTIPQVNLDNLYEVYSKIGYTIVVGIAKNNSLKRKSKPINCVSVCKRLLKIDRSSIRTPYQLYSFLKKQKYQLSKPHQHINSYKYEL